MRIGTWMAAALMAPVPAIAAGGSLWSYTFQNGIGEYLTGQWDSPTGGALAISCKDGAASIAAQIKGQAPPAASILTLKTSSRDGSVEHRFRTAEGATVPIADAAGSAAFAALWADLRARDIVTVRYADDRWEVLSLAGAMKTLPRTPCG